MIFYISTKKLRFLCSSHGEAFPRGQILRFYNILPKMTFFCLSTVPRHSARTRTQTRNTRDRASRQLESLSKVKQGEYKADTTTVHGQARFASMILLDFQYYIVGHCPDFQLPCPLNQSELTISSIGVIQREKLLSQIVYHQLHHALNWLQLNNPLYLNINASLTTNKPTR